MKIAQSWQHCSQPASAPFWRTERLTENDHRKIKIILAGRFSKICCIHLKSQKTSVLQSLKQLKTLLSFWILPYPITFIHMIVKIMPYLLLLNLDLTPVIGVFITLGPVTTHCHNKTSLLPEWRRQKTSLKPPISNVNRVIIQRNESASY